MNDYARLKKGAAWECRVHRAMFGAGWYVRRNINLRERVAGAPQVMAEIDILGISFDAGLNARRAIGECKDRRGSGQEADRVIWLLGLGQLLGSEELMLAKPRIAPGTVRFAKSTNVALFEEASVTQIERRLDEAVRTAGSFDADIAEDIVAPAVSRAALADNRLRDAYDWIHSAAWTEQPIPRIKRMPGYFRLVTEHATGDTRHVLLIEGLLGLLMCSLEVAGLLRRHSPSVGRALSAEALASGAAPASVLKEIAATADDYYRNAFARESEKQIGKRLMITAPRLAEHIANPPSWSDSFFSMAESLGSRPELATELLRYTDLALYERLAGRDPAPAQAAFISGSHAWLDSALAMAARFCSRIWNLDDPFFAELINTGDHHPGDADATSAPDGAAEPSGAAPASAPTRRGSPPPGQESLAVDTSSAPKVRAPQKRQSKP